MKKSLFTLLFTLLLAGNTLAQDCTGNQVGGQVFRDYNANGLRDSSEPGSEGLLINVYNSAEALIGSAATDFSGKFTLPLQGISGEQVRVEFLNQTSYLKYGSAGSQQETSVQFVQLGDCDLSLAVNNPRQYCQDNPRVAIACYINGSGANSTRDGYVSFGWENNGVPLKLGGAESDPVLDAQVQQIGSVYGAAFDPFTQRLYTSSFVKRHVGTTSTDLGLVYVLDYTNNLVSLEGSFSLEGIMPENGGPQITLGSVNRLNIGDLNVQTGAAGDFELSENSSRRNRDLDGFAKVGKTSFGGISLDEDGKSLWLVNMEQQALISTNLGNNLALLPQGVQQYILNGLPGLPVCADFNNSGDVLPTGAIRPWAIKIHDGRGYLGVTCSAENSQDAGDLRAFVLSFNPENVAAGFEPVLEIPLDYNREVTSSGNNGASGDAGEWRAWARDWADTGFGSTNRFQLTFPQPILSDLEFTSDGSMAIGINDRFGHQTGNENFSFAISGNANSTRGETAGDILFACRTAGGFILEGLPGCAVSEIADGSLGSRLDDGPSNQGEYFFDDTFVRINSPSFRHYEIATGGIAANLNTNEVLTSVIDPVSDVVLNNAGFYTQGVIRFDQTSGRRTGGFTVVGRDNTNTFGKASGLGDPELICDAAPLEIGNRVWFDLNGDGIQGASERPIAGVTIVLQDNSGNILGQTTTDAQGNYFFGGINNANLTAGSLLPETQYMLAISITQSVLTELELTGENLSDADFTDSDGTLSGSFAEILLFTGPNGENNHSYDYGFKPQSQLVINLGETKVLIDSSGQKLLNQTLAAINTRRRGATLEPALCQSYSLSQQRAAKAAAKLNYTTGIWAETWNQLPDLLIDFGTTPQAGCELIDLRTAKTEMLVNARALRRSGRRLLRRCDSQWRRVARRVKTLKAAFKTSRILINELPDSGYRCQ